MYNFKILISLIFGLFSLFKNQNNTNLNVPLKPTQNSFKTSVRIDKTLTDMTGRIYQTISSSSDEYNWYFSFPVPVSNIIFTFNNLQMYSSQLLIFDNNKVNALYSCVSCGYLLPPPFNSTSSVIRIQALGVSGTTFTPSSFILSYIAVVKSISNSAGIYSNISIDLNIGHGKVQPINILGQVPSHYQSIWKIRPVDSSIITFAFFRLNLPSKCINTSLKVYDGIFGNLLFDGCNNNQTMVQLSTGKWFYSKSSKATIIFQNNNSIPIFADFQLYFYADSELFHCGGGLVNPLVLISNSWLITDGSVSGKSMRRNDYCSWILLPSTLSTNLVLNFEWLSLKAGTVMSVYDGTSTNAPLLWQSNNGLLGTILVPPRLDSSTGSLFVTFLSNAFVGSKYLGFRGNYLSQYYGSGNNQEVLSMSTSFQVSLPTVVHKAYSWFINPLQLLSTDSIYLFISHLQLFNNNDCLYIFEGFAPIKSLLVQYCGPQPSNTDFNWVISHAGLPLWLHYKTLTNNQENVTNVFQFSYFSDGLNYHCGFPNHRVALLTSSSMFFTDGSRSTEGILPSQNCQWIISPNNNNQQVAVAGVALYFSRVDIFGGSITIFDSTNPKEPVLLLTIVNTNLIPAAIILNNASRVSIVYNTSNQVYGRGFSISYATTNSYSNELNKKNSIFLYSASMLSLKLPLNQNMTFNQPNFTWFIQPQNAQPKSLYFVFSFVNLVENINNYNLLSNEDCYQAKNISKLLLFNNGTQMELVAAFCGQSRPTEWYSIPSNRAVLMYISPSSSSRGYAAHQTPFEVSYFSDAPSYHCGISTNGVAMITASSMQISDGSANNTSMKYGDECEWNIYPYICTNENSMNCSIVFLFERLDMRGGGVISIFEGNNDEGNLLWECRSCNHLPSAIVSHSPTLFIKYISPSIKLINQNSPLGLGFKAHYYVLENNNNNNIKERKSFILEHPNEFVFFSNGDSINNNNNSNSDYNNNNDTNPYWYLQSGVTTSQVTLSNAFQFNKYKNYIINSYDGKPYNYNHNSTDDNSIPYLCGIVSSHYPIRLLTSSFNLLATQIADEYIYQNQSRNKALYKTFVDKDYILYNDNQDNNNNNNIIGKAPHICKFALESGSVQAMKITIEFYEHSGLNYTIFIYSGVPNNETLFYYHVGSQYTHNNISIIAPCGTAYIQVNLDNTINNINQRPIEPVFFKLHYYNILTDNKGKICDAYIKSLLIQEPPVPFFEKYQTMILVFFFMFILLITCINKRESLKESVKLNYARILRKITFWSINIHPRHTPTLDYLRNKLLPRGVCCICTDTLPVIRLQCDHTLCLSDLETYLNVALGDISMFPLKCPMHYQGCLEVIPVSVAKRVLDEDKYNRFLDFLDKSLYGEGLRCINCRCYILFPTDGNASSVQCPYCSKRYCLKCKTPWHYRRKCKFLESDSDSVAAAAIEYWRQASGAQKCPSCKKVIEKNDSNTCHHMIHKSSDFVPCIRPRTDFCYLCGTEVLPDYPHDEVHSPGVNHFPDGVFQLCRVITQRKRNLHRRQVSLEVNANRRVGRNTIIPVVNNEVEITTARSNISALSDRTEGSSVANSPSRIRLTLND